MPPSRPDLACIDVDGRRACMAAGGAANADAATLVLIHGAGHDHHVWDEVATTLAAAGLGTIAPDLPGHGGSDGPPLGDIAALADWLLALLDGLDRRTFCLAGHSMGSLIALAAAARAPDRCSRLVLIGSVVPMPVAPVLLDAARSDRANAHAMINKWSFGPAEALGGERLALLAARNLQRLEREPADALAVDLAACNAWQGGLDAAAAVRCPTLLICGERDRMTPPEAAQLLLDALQGPGRDARMIRIPGAGHSMMDEAPATVSDSMRAFVASSP